MRTFFKDPDEDLDWVFDWSTWLDTGETITDSSVTAANGITLGDGTNGAPAPSHDDTSVLFWLLGGTDGQKYKVSNTIATSEGRISTRSILVWVSVR